MKDSLPKILFIFAIAALVFGYGFVSGSMQIFPYNVIKEARIAFNALQGLTEENDTSLRNMAYWEDSATASAVYDEFSTSAGDEHVFVLGNDLTNGGQPGEQSMLAWIADRQGNVKHAWEHPGEIWAPLQDRDAVGDTWRSYPVGAHLYDNGDLLVSYQGDNVFPIAMGLAKFDKDSNLIWKQNGLFHHWFSVGPDGNIYVPGTAISDSPMKIVDRQKEIFCSDGKVTYDTIAILDESGVVKKEIDLLNAFIDSDLSGVFNSGATAPIALQSCDPMHLNDVQVLTEALSSEFPALSPGDLLLSFRSLNAIGVLDPVTEKFKWFHAGSSQHQHSPRYFRDNKVLLFDNYGGRTSEGTSRVVAVDIGSGQSETLFPRSDSTHPGRDILSRVAGYVDVSPSRDRMMVAFSEQGLVWEIDTANGEVLWEFVNTQAIAGRPGRVKVFVTKYVDKLSFPMNGGEL